MFNSSDKFKLKSSSIVEIMKITDHFYISTTGWRFYIKDQDEYELVPETPMTFKDENRIYCDEACNLLNTKNLEESNVTTKEIKDQGYYKLCNPSVLVSDEIKPKFKVGDRIRYVGEDFVIKIIDIKNNQYHIECFDNKCNDYKNGIISVSEQNFYKLIPKFDIRTLKPFDKVLVRDSYHEKWNINFFSCIDNAKMFKTIIGTYFQCIPYEGNEHLLDKIEDCDPFYQTWK